MNLRFFIFTVLPIFFIVFNGYSQPKSNCSCPALMKETAGKTASMYAGFDDRVTSTTRKDYQQMLQRLTEKAKGAYTDRDCYEVMKSYLQWFNDTHMGMWYGLNTTSKDIRTVSNKYLESSVHLTAGVEGTWVRDDLGERWKIIPDPDHRNAFLAVVLDSRDSGWQTGMVRVEFYYYDSSLSVYRGMFYRNDFKGNLDGLSLTGNRLTHWLGKGLHRENAPIAEASVGDADVVFKQLDTDVCYLKLAHFNENEVHQLDSLIQLNKAAIHSTKNLIIDLRGNPGGNSGSSQKMIELIYTNPILYPAWQYRATPAFIAENENEVTQLKSSDPYRRLADTEKKLEQLKSHPGQMVTMGDSILRTCDSIAAFPRKVALLIDKHSASSSEFFIFEAKQSSKTIIYGTNSIGDVDYGDVHSSSLSCEQYSLGIPWGRNGWIDRFGYHINNIGFKPDLEIKGDNVDWIKFVAENLKSQH